MNTKQLLCTLLLTGTVFTMNAQDVSSTATLTSGGLEAGTTGFASTFYGYRAGKINTGVSNCFFGHQSGKSNSTGRDNTFIGRDSGATNTIGNENMFSGLGAGYSNISGSANTYIGYNSGSVNNSSHNTFVGANTGATNSSGDNNTFIGYAAGGEASGSNNVFIGNNAGFSESQSNILNIDNEENYTPLIWGDFAADQLKFNARVGIGGVTSFPTFSGTYPVSKYNLFVKGGILTEEVRVSIATTWADYVFEDSYKLTPLSDVECFIMDNGHLPNVPSAARVKEEGIELGDMARIQQEKIEELTLYAIQQQKQLDRQEAEIKELKAIMQAIVEKK